MRDIWVRYVQDYPIENNDWGDFQTHRRLIGLITVGKFDTQTELNELCRVHESLKVKYTNTLFDSRCILFGSLNNRQNLTESSTDEYNSLSSNGSSIHQSYMNFNSPSSNDDSAIQTSTEQNNSESTQFTTPNNFKSRAFFYNEQDSCFDLEVNMTEFINSLFWVLESKRLERTKEKLDKVTLLLAPFEKRDFVGLDLETRNNKKRLMGRVTKNLADLTLQAGLVAESLTLFHAASETLRAISDSLWLGAANEGLCAASAILLYPNCRLTNVELQRNASLPTENSPQKITTTRVLPTTANNIQDHASQLPSLSSKVHCKKFGPNVAVNSFDIKNNVSTTTTTTKTINQTVDSSSASSSTSSVSSMVSGSSSASTPSGQIDRRDILLGTAYPSNILMPDDITNKYRDAIINYSKYRHAGIIETEAALKAARICIEQNQNLDVAMFLQNALYIDLNMTEQERVQRFETLTGLYQKIGYHRKAAFCQRLAAWRHVAKNNSNPDWNQSYRIMLDSFSGHRMSLDPIEVLQSNSGWPCLQVDLLQQLVVAARRLGHSALATRHMTFLLQTMWKHLSADAQKEMALQLQSLSSQCEGAPVPLVLESGIVIPPANLTDLPYCEHFHVKNLPPHLRPHKIVTQKIDQGPFLFTPIHFNSMQNHHKSKQSGPESKINFNWIQNDLCEVVLRLKNPLPFELRVDDMRLLTNGIVFESLPQSIVLPISSSNSAAIPNSSSSITTSITLHGTPIEYGTLDIQGYSTHTLGVKSNCRLKHMNGRKFPNNYQIDVIPALPKLDISTSLPQTATFSGMSNADSVIVSASVTLFNGENTECLVTLTNNSNVPIEFLDESIQSTLDAKLQKQIFNWSHDDIQSKLPILPNSFIEFKLLIYADADFLGPIIFGGGITSLTSSQQNHYGLSDGPQSITVGMNTLSVSGGHTSIPSRVSSPVPNVSVPQRRTELTSSFRSTHSGHSSLASISLAAAGSGGGGGGGVGGTSGYMVRHLESQFRFRYSGGEALQEGYCRQCSISFNLEFLPSAHVTNWDVLPAEMLVKSNYLLFICLIISSHFVFQQIRPSQFYLVLDVVNLTAQEMSLNYTSNKNILIEAKESCRVPIPVERCPLERFYTSSDGNGSVQNYTTDNPSMFNYFIYEYQGAH